MPRARKIAPSSPRLPESLSDVWKQEFPRREAKVFSRDFVTNLAARHKIGRAKIPGLKKALEGWADVYLAYKESDNRPRPGRIIAEIENLRARINELRTTLEQLSKEADDLFWLHETHIRPLPFSDENVFTSEYGHTIRLIPTGPDTKAIVYLQKHHHFESLTVLQRYCEAALERLRLRTDVGGRKRSQALRMWAVNVINYWEDKNGLDRLFTIKTYKGQPATDGASFGVEAFKPIDPTVSVAQLLTAMRHVWATKQTPKRRVARTPPK